ncbi:NudC domain-containing protein 1 [Durusdinium trenchii]|uniref:NudC domain-containing protein 1 n=1 Tax=Durusdinium trenchii TaxID=1381693 RepID=A0ABP0PCG2_9DINO
MEPEPEEENATKEERMAWLRARGVRIEEPGQQSGPAVTASGRSFIFVKIPADDSSSCEELEGPHSQGDALPSILGSKFAGCELSDDELKAHAAIQGQPTVDVFVLRKLVTQGRAESFRLAVPTEANGRETVYAYLDEASEMKLLPLNQRASAIAQSCGFPSSCQFRGDIYIGRLRWLKGGLVENIDIRLPEMELGSFWMKRAITENLEFQASTQPEEHARAQAGAEHPASGSGDGYTWKDEEEELEVILEVPEGTTKKDVKIDFRREEVRILKPKTLTLKLFKSVEVDGCSWTMGKGQIVITLEKSEAAPWPQLLKELEGLYL